MPWLTVSWEYLTGAAVTAVQMGGRPEWPPHPGRVFMALAAAWFETEPPDDEVVRREEWEQEGRALRWLESLGDPELHLPHVEQDAIRSAVTVYVPVNDKAGPSAAPLQSAPALTRNKQARSFPQMWVGHGTCAMRWQVAISTEQFQDRLTALDRLCRKVTRIGHSSSLVRMWADAGNGRDVGRLDTEERWLPDEGDVEQHCRVVTPGTLDALPVQTQIPRIVQFAEMDTRIRSSKGKEQRAHKADFERVFGEKWKSSTPPPPLLRPRLGITRGYRRDDRRAGEAEIPQGLFDLDILALKHVGGPRLPLTSTLAVTSVLRKTIMSRSGVQPAPPWITGHEPNGEPRRSDADGHLACVPLPFVGHQHADGHLLGVGLVFPRSVDRRERGRALGPVLIDRTETLEPREITLTLGPLGEWTVRKCDWSESRRSLAAETWSAAPRGASTWASVTPVVLDRFPKADRRSDRAAWSREVAEIVEAACLRIGLPAPDAIDIDTTSWHRGSPRAFGKERPLRGGSAGARDRAALGDGFPWFPARGTGSARPQVHVWIRFPAPVLGPILLGAGRYLGYGWCKPLATSH